MEVTRPQLTPQQAAAINTRGVSVALSAGAGCGKTFVLTQRFLKQLQTASDSDPLSGIVAITFTERAAREMRDRIRAACHAELERCSGETVPYWLQIIRGLDSARISTIHSFCASLLRAHAVDAEIDPQFGVLESSMAAAFRRRVVSESIHELLSRRDDDCMQLVLHYGLERTKHLIRVLVLQRFQADFEQFEPFTPERLAADWSRRWQAEFVPRLLRAMTDSPASAQLLRLLEENEPTHAEMQRRRAFLLKHLPGLHQADDPFELLTGLREAAQVQGGGGKKVWANETIYEDVKNSLGLLRKAIDHLTKDFQFDEQQVHTAAQFGLAGLRVAKFVSRHYETQKQAAGVLDFDDLLLRTRNLLRDTPSVCTRAAAGIDFLMVDEFQDTDPVQADIVRRLCGGELLAGKLFFVGDRKQSIYRFRRADPAVFASLRDDLPAQGRLPLSTNFRSQPAILNFVNCVFASSLGEDYEPLTAHVAEQLSPTPAVEFLFASLEPDADDDKATAEGRRELEADWIARRIRGFLQDATPRIRQQHPNTGETQLRPVQPGDVAILFRTLSNVPTYEDALRRYGIHYHLVGGRAFYAQQEVYDLINLCQYLDDCDDQVSLAGVLRSPFFSLADDTLYAMVEASGTLGNALAKPPPGQLPAQQHRQLRYASSVLGELRRKKDRLPLPELLHLALERTAYDAALLNEFLGRRKLANLRKLIEMARSFDRSGLFTLTEFVQRMRESVSEGTDEELAATHPETSETVRLMTIHQAKGLEFPIVVLGNMDWKRHGGFTTAHFDPELGPLLPLPARHGETPQNLGLQMHKLVEGWEDESETIRLFYVAATRAADYLILSAGMGRNRKPTSPWLKLLSERFDLSTGLPAVDPYLGRLTLSNVAPSDIPEIRVHHEAPAVGPAAELHDQKPGFFKKAGLLRVSEFRRAVEGAECVPLPETLAPLSPTTSAEPQFSVSQIEEADAEIRGAVSEMVIKERDGGEEDISPDDATALGTLVHEVLEWIDFRNPGSLESLLEESIQTAAESVTDAMRTGALVRLQAFLTSPLVAELADAKQCYRELDFLLRWPKGAASAETVIISGQIDCLVQSAAGRFQVLDYKTGRPAKDDTATLLAKYEVQLALYALAVREWIGRLPDSVEIVLLGKDAVRIPLNLTDEMLAKIADRVNAAIGRLRGD